LAERLFGLLCQGVELVRDFGHSSTVGQAPRA
jgi:hypothetical protein